MKTLRSQKIVGRPTDDRRWHQYRPADITCLPLEPVEFPGLDHRRALANSLVFTTFRWKQSGWRCEQLVEHGAVVERVAKLMRQRRS